MLEVLGESELKALAAHGAGGADAAGGLEGLEPFWEEGPPILTGAVGALLPVGVCCPGRGYPYGRGGS